MDVDILTLHTETGYFHGLLNNKTHLGNGHVHSSRGSCSLDGRRMLFDKKRFEARVMDVYILFLVDASKIHKELISFKGYEVSDSHRFSKTSLQAVTS